MNWWQAVLLFVFWVYLFTRFLKLYTKDLLYKDAMADMITMGLQDLFNFSLIYILLVIFFGIILRFVFSIQFWQFTILLPVICIWSWWIHNRYFRYYYFSTTKSTLASPMGIGGPNSYQSASSRGRNIRLYEDYFSSYQKLFKRLIIVTVFGILLFGGISFIFFTIIFKGTLILFNIVFLGIGLGCLIVPLSNLQWKRKYEAVQAA